MNTGSVDLRPLPRVQPSRYLQACLSALLMLAMATAVAGQPCKPFEDGRVDPQILEVMRSAAREGSLYRVVPGYSRVGFCVRYFPMQEFRGDFTNIVGGLVLPSMEHQYGQALLLIHTSTLEASDGGLAPLVRGHEFMDTDRYPEILFVGRAFEWLGPLQGYIYGDLTLRGITQPVVFNVGIDILEEGLGNMPDRISLKGTGQVSRYQFDMHHHRFTISETVRLCLDTELVPWAPLSTD
ncbi:MAG: YceI family protein [Gammaproteobacteria bacterium]|nr:YceI family protein [Gammaproteobacteria bacterium]